jgi:hypothetical protein
VPTLSLWVVHVEVPRNFQSLSFPPEIFIELAFVEHLGWESVRLCGAPLGQVCKSP